MTNLKASAHKQTFYSRGTYSVEKNEIFLATEIPKILILEGENTYSLKLKNCYNISSSTIPCMLVVYSHGHPTNREKLPSENLDWDRKTLQLDSVFEHTEFPQEKILVITLHDEDFEESQIAIYRFFVNYHASFNQDANDYLYDLQLLQDFIAGKSTEIKINEEPRTAGGGVIDPG